MLPLFYRLASKTRQLHWLPGFSKVSVFDCNQGYRFDTRAEHHKLSRYLKDFLTKDPALTCVLDARRNYVLDVTVDKQGSVYCTAYLARVPAPPYNQGERRSHPPSHFRFFVNHGEVLRSCHRSTEDLLVDNPPLFTRTFLNQDIG